MSFNSSGTEGNLFFSRSRGELSRVEGSGEWEENLTVQYFEDRPSHDISQFEEVESDIFELSRIRTYDEPVDSEVVPSFNKKEVQSLKKKFEEFKLGQNDKKRVTSSKSPRPFVNSPLNVLKKTDSLSKKTSNPDISPLTPLTTQPSYKKPLITLAVTLFGKEITQDIYHGDFSIDVAKKIFSKVSTKPSQSDLKSLSQQIEQNVQSYLSEVAAELLKFHQNTKKIEEKTVKKKLENFKPPLLLTARRADEKKLTLGPISLNLGGKNVLFSFKDGENPFKVAEQVCEAQNVSRDFLLEIVKQVKNLQDKNNEKFLFRLELEVNGKVAEVALYEGDDLTAVSQKFCREHKLGREYVAKIEEVLHKQLNSVI